VASDQGRGTGQDPPNRNDSRSTRLHGSRRRRDAASASPDPSAADQARRIRRSARSPRGGNWSWRDDYHELANNLAGHRAISRRCRVDRTRVRHRGGVLRFRAVSPRSPSASSVSQILKLKHYPALRETNWNSTPKRARVFGRHQPNGIYDRHSSRRRCDDALARDTPGSLSDTAGASSSASVLFERSAS